jgi:hypothetical protein
LTNLLSMSLLSIDFVESCITGLGGSKLQPCAAFSASIALRYSEDGTIGSRVGDWLLQIGSGAVAHVSYVVS